MSYDGRTDSDGAKQGVSSIATATREEGQQVVEEAKSQARDVTQSARQHTEHLGEEAKQQAHDVVSDVRTQARRQADEQTARAADALRDVGNQLRCMAQSAPQPGTVVELAHQAATKADTLATSLEQRGVDGVFEDVRRYARQHPGTFLLAAGAAGFLAGRLARNASSALRDDGSSPPVEGTSTMPSFTPSAPRPTPGFEPDTGVSTWSEGLQ